MLAAHYGFTDEELDFILNYDIKYRLGADEGEEYRRGCLQLLKDGLIYDLLIGRVRGTSTKGISREDQHDSRPD